MQITGRTTVYEGFHKIRKITLQENDQAREREQLDRGNSVAALVYDEANHEIVLTKQYRVGPEKPLVEVVAGSMDDPSENPAETIKREIREEVGYQVEMLEYIDEFYTSPGAYTEKIFLYAASVKQQIEEGGGVGGENITPHRLSVPEFQEAVFEDAKTIIAQCWWRQHDSLFLE